MLEHQLLNAQTTYMNIIPFVLCVLVYWLPLVPQQLKCCQFLA